MDETPNLRERLAAVIQRERGGPTLHDSDFHTADAIIADLGLRTHWTENRPPEAHRLNVIASAVSEAWQSWLPLSVRYEAARVADVVVKAWDACETYDEWAARNGGTGTDDA